MPASRLHARPVTILQFDVGGQDSDASPEFVRHVGLARKVYENVNHDTSTIQMVHMGPPLRVDTQDAASRIQVRGTASLTTEERLQISVFVDELTSEREAEAARNSPRYIVCPHAICPDERIPYWRFSCAGFTIEAYRDAGIDLLDTRDTALPFASIEMLCTAYPDQARNLNHERMRSILGLIGQGPWPVVLAGYVVNALARDADSIRKSPYVAVKGDEFFPPRAPTLSVEENVENGDVDE